MTESSTIRFENNTIKKLKVSREYRIRAILFLIMCVLAIYVFSIFGGRGRHLGLTFKIAMPTVVLVGLGIYFLFKNNVTAITFNKTEKQITIDYYRHLRNQSISFAYNKFKYEIEEMRSSLYSSNKTRFLRITLYNQLTFLITSDSLIDEGMDFEAILEVLKEIKNKRS